LPSHGRSFWGIVSQARLAQALAVNNEAKRGWRQLLDVYTRVCFGCLAGVLLFSVYYVNYGNKPPADDSFSVTQSLFVELQWRAIHALLASYWLVLLGTATAGFIEYRHSPPMVVKEADLEKAAQTVANASETQV
jgi:hypothetical protein